VLNTEYDSEPGTHKADMLAYLDQGHHLVNHHEHCNWNSMGAGWTCHSDLITETDVNGLTNGDRQSIVFAIGCWPCDITYTTCIGEAFLQREGGGCRTSCSTNRCSNWGCTTWGTASAG